jgi:TonB-dependent SusC/RagA subfamily outer membrane receptor
MSLSRSHPSLYRVASILACGPALVALGGCYRASSAVHNPSPAELVTVGNGYRSNDEQRLPRFPGINVVRTPNGGFLVRILSGMVGDGQLLYVIDGAPAFINPSRGIDWLSLDDIAQISVLKGPAETSVYGPLGVNGVIVITTKLAANMRKRGRD